MSLFSSRKFLFAAAAAILVFIFASCDGIFPSQTKSNIPPDHNSSYGGYWHIGKEGNGSDDCNHCHGSDLRGQVYNYNGTNVVTPSCYQCHGSVWERENGGNGN